MSEPQRIESRQNPRIKNLVRLRERSHRSRQELFIIEGTRELSRAFAAGVALQEVYVCPDLTEKPEARALLDDLQASGLPLFELSPGVFEKASYREKPDGVLATAAQWPLGLEALELGEAPLLLILESIEKPGNIGAMLRSADAAGASAVILADPVADLFSPNVVRASQGALFSVKVAAAPTTEILAWLQEKQVSTYATTPDTQASLWSVPLTGACALVLGSEAYGLSPAWLESSAVSKIRIPMREGATDSLNVSTAAAVCLFEAARQRNKAFSA